MSLHYSCTCGKMLHAPEAAAGRRARCPQCGTITMVPFPDLESGEETETLAAPKVPAARQPAPIPMRASVPEATASPLLANFAASLPGRPSLWRRYAYLVLLLALIPLAIFTLHRKTDEDLTHRLSLTVEHHPEIAPQVIEMVQKIEAHEASEEELFNVLPDHRLEGALLAHESKAHWLIGLAAAGGYFAVLLVVFTGAKKYTKGLLFAGFFTGMVGILLLLLFQWAAYVAPVTFRGGGGVGLILLIVKLIGMSYRLAESDVGFFLSFLGFTFGVGLCEEITKAIPLLLRVKSIPGDEEASWGSLLLWGLASGIGFGVAEGIMYCGQHYNGLQGSEIYYVRFISCVVLHAIWSGAVGVTLYNRQAWLHQAENNWEYCFRVILIVLVPMVLHGLYDTLLKQDYHAWALVVALLSFGWLAWQIELMRRKEPDSLLAGT